MLNYTIIKCVIIHRKKKAAGAGKDFTLFFGVMLHFNFKCEGYQGCRKRQDLVFNNRKGQL